MTLLEELRDCLPALLPMLPFMLGGLIAGAVCAPRLRPRRPRLAAFWYMAGLVTYLWTSIWYIVVPLAGWSMHQARVQHYLIGLPLLLVLFYGLRGITCRILRRNP